MAQVEDHSAPLLVGGALTDLALLVDEPDWDHASKERVATFLARVRVHVTAEQAIQLRQARVLCWMRTKDVAELGFPSWEAFVDEHSTWSAGWTRKLMRLVESPLERVKEAVSDDLVPLSVAVRAVGRIMPEEQADWIMRVLEREEWGTSARTDRSDLDVVWGAAARKVERSREIAQVLVGWEASVRRLDEAVRGWFEQKAMGAALVEAAKVPPSVPERIGQSVPEWPSDPATSVLGPWVEPPNLGAALEMLEHLQALEHDRTAALGMAYTIIKVHALWQYGGAESLEAFVRTDLGRSVRTFQRYANMGMELFLHPEIRAAVADGLPLGRAEVLTQLASERTIAQWMELLGRLGHKELRRAVQWEGEALKRYGPVIEEAARREATERSGKRYRVALRDGGDRPPSPPGYLFVPRGQVEAATWVVENVALPKEGGIRRTIERDRRTCQNPYCRRQCLRLHVHHMIEQQHGGTDDESNLVSVCSACHLRLIHSGRMHVRREGEFLLWTWGRLRPVIMHSPLPSTSWH